MSYFFFYSYARDDFDIYQKKFYNDLLDEIRGLKGYSVDCFRDEENIHLGESWPESLAEALKTSQIFIYIHSPFYFNREWCGKEWYTFRIRLFRYKEEQLGNEAIPPLMLPVLWIPCNPPECASDIQFAHKELGDVYMNEGLRYIMKLKKHEDDYQEFLTRFSKKIVDLVEEHKLPEMEILPSIKKVKNAFEENILLPSHNKHKRETVGPRYAQFVYVAGKESEINETRNYTLPYGREGGLDWKPFFPQIRDEIILMTQEIATKEKFYHLSLAFQKSLADSIEDSLTKYKIVIVIIDPWTLLIERYSNILKKLDQSQPYNCAIIVIFNKDDEETKGSKRSRLIPVLEATLINNTLNKKNTDLFKDNIESFEEFNTELIHVLQKVKANIVKANVIEAAEKISKMTDKDAFAPKTAPVISA